MEMGYAKDTAKELGVSAGGVASFLVIGKILSVIAGGINFIIIARLLQPSSYGVYTLALGLFGLISAFSSLNIGAYFNTRIPYLAAKKDHEALAKELGNGFVLSILLGLVLAAIVLAGMGIINNYIFHSAAANTIIIIAAFGTIIATIWSNISAALISFGEGRHAGISNIIGTVVQAIVSIALVLLGYGAEGAFLGIFIGFLIGSIYGLFFLYKYSKIVFDIGYFANRIKGIFSFSVPLTISNTLNGLIASFAVLFLGSLVAANVVGAYGVATRLGNFMDIIIGSINAVLIPMFASAYTSKKVSKHVGKLYDYSIYFGFLFAMPVIIYVIVFANPLISALFSSTYTSTLQVLQVPVIGTLYVNTPFYIGMIGIGILISIISNFGTALATSKGDVDKVLKYSVILFVVQLASMLVLVPLYGAVGLIISVFFINNIVGLALFYNYVKAKLKLIVAYDVERVIIANVLLGIVLVAVLLLFQNQFVQIIAGILAALLAYPAILGLTRGIGHEELGLLKQILTKMPSLGFFIKPFIEYAGWFTR